MAAEEDVEQLESKLSEVEKKVSALTADENKNMVVENFKLLSNTDGSTNTNGLWNKKEELFQKMLKPFYLLRRTLKED